ncbi:Short-chain dehydrogenase/reductase SDR [Penicillium coprophilum]|uniref:Short-chain dehydrogenase/reductase SDR n=1 Tax=Penicillium coprophilum TaxID=36646 RepID=UPI0023A3B239|nr:Short-chain dehydrogenase/reductase SDR [Penicillium coprophilum]KAJ5153717.1 Short-chain dehydrogenase/reductase SDR [Penicillium coprophilum]
MASTVVLITGANRGIGKGILELYLKKPNHLVIAANRDPTHPSSNALVELPKAEGTTLEIIKIDALSPTDPAAAVKALAVKGITHIDVLVANAAIALSWPKVSDVKVEEIQEHIDVNVNFVPMQNAAYAPSKAIQHWYTKAISVEDPWLNAFPVDPGWVQTDLGNRGAHAIGVEKAAITVEDSTTGIVRIIDASTLQTHSGKLFKFDGNEEPW